MIYIIIVIIGSSLGSFLYCINTNKKIFRRSRCENCRKILNIIDLIPIISYIYLKGRCRYCKEKIKIEYLFWELLTSVLFCLLYIKFNLNIQYYLLTILFISLSIKDFHELIIPDYYHILFMFIRFISNNNYLLSINNGIAISLTLLVIVLINNFMMHKETMGLGDIKLFFSLGLYFDYYDNLLILLFSSLSALIYCLIKKEDKQYAFGPFICFSYYVFFLIK